MLQTIEKEAFVSKINQFELVVVNCLYYKENTYHRQSIREQTVLRFWIGLDWIGMLYFTLTKS